METSPPSFTALAAAAARAAHLLVDAEPFIFADTLAAALLGERAEELMSYHRLHGTHPVLAGARAQVSCRGRYTETALGRAISHGVTQDIGRRCPVSSISALSCDPCSGKDRVLSCDYYYAVAL